MEWFKRFTFRRISSYVTLAYIKLTLVLSCGFSSIALATSTIRKTIYLIITNPKFQNAKKIKEQRKAQHKSSIILYISNTWNIGVMPVPPAIIPNDLTWLGWYLKRPCRHWSILQISMHYIILVSVWQC